jgi:hypothetical protein
MAEATQHGVHPRPVLFAFIAFGVVLVGIALGVRALAGRWEAATPPAPRAEIAGPRLQSTAMADRLRFEAGKRRRLESFGWVDRSRGIAHIPIDLAMRLLAERGARPGAPDATAHGEARDEARREAR